MTYTSSQRRHVFDPAALVQRAIDSDFDSAIFRAIDDSAIDHAPNWLEWCLGKNFLNLEEVLPRQVQLATVFLGEYCPRCSKPDFIQDLLRQSISDIRENVTLLEHAICPKCKVTQLELYDSKELGEYNELDCVVGRRGGKSALVSMLASYHLHRVLSLSSPSKYYGTMENDTLSFVFLAVTAKQARETLWDKFTARIDSAPWFKQYHKLLGDIAKTKGMRVADLYKYETNYLTYFHKSIHCAYYTPDTTTLRGLTTIFYAIDELGYFDNQANSNKVKANAEETYGSMDVSNQTVRNSVRHLRRVRKINNVPTAQGVNISSPYSNDDMIMRLLKTSYDRPNALGYLYATWNANPKITRDELWAETVDKKQFYRNYECIPSMGGDRVFLGETSLVNRCIIKEKENLFEYSFHTELDKVDTSLETVYASVHIKKPDRGTPRVLGIDMGYMDNSFALVMSSYQPGTDTVLVDGVIECEPIKHANGNVTPINTVMMFEKCIVPILENYNILYVVYDQWNSLDAVQRIRSKYRVNAEQCSLTFSDFSSIIKSTIYEGKLHIPAPEVNLDQLQKYKFEDVITSETPIANLQYQMLTVQEMGRKITKPYKGNDDLFRAMSLTVKYIKNPDLIGRFSTANQMHGGFRGNNSHIGTVKLYSSFDPRFAQNNQNPVVNTIGRVASSYKHRG